MKPLPGGRWRVRLEGSEKALRPENLAVLNEAAAFCPAVVQSVEVLEDEEKIPRLLRILRDVQEAEKKGLVQRSLTLVFCSEASVAAVALALGQRQVGCLKLTAASQKDRLKGFHLDGKRVLVSTDEALSSWRSDELARVVSFDLVDLASHRSRLERLNGSLKDEAGYYYAFLSKKVPAEVCKGLVDLLRAARFVVDTRLEELAKLAAASEAPRIVESKTKKRKRRPSKGAGKSVRWDASKSQSREGRRCYSTTRFLEGRRRSEGPSPSQLVSLPSYY